MKKVRFTEVQMVAILREAETTPTQPIERTLPRCALQRRSWALGDADDD